MKIFLLNAPPGAGKDTTAEAVVSTTDFAYIHKFAAPIKRHCAATYCGGDRKLFDYHDTYERKGIPNALFLGKSCRQVQIDFSEKYMKKEYGEKVFGEILANDLTKIHNHFELQNMLITDSGFRPEAEVLVDRFGADNLTLIRLQKKGHTYEGDSRSYIQLEDLGVNCYDVENVQGEQQITINIIKEIIRGNQ